MKYPEIIAGIIDAGFDEETEFLKELIGIESVVSEAETLEDGEVAPFGKGVDDAFKCFLRKADAFGFATENVENYGGHVEMIAKDSAEAKTLGIIGHLDTVPIGNGWKYNPLGELLAAIDGNRYYGRGMIDDKGPMVACLFAMKAIQTAIDNHGVRIKNNVRLILGLDEETNWYGLKKYKENVEAPDFGFTPDANFPAINGEMGILVFDIAKKFSKANDDGLVLRTITGGSAPNMVADMARAIVLSKDKQDYEYIKSLAAQTSMDNKVHIKTRVMGKAMEITATGKAAHGSRPILGINAISGLMHFLGKLHFANEGVQDFLKFYNENIGFELDGKSLGCYRVDDISGETIVNIGQIELDNEAVRLTVNIRYPIKVTSDEIYAGMQDVCNLYNLGIVKRKDDKPLYLAPDSQLISNLMDVYREHTGDKDSQPMIIGGGTYARGFDNFVAFGAGFPGEMDLSHQKDEYLCLERIKELTHIYADAIYRLVADATN